MQAKYEKVVDPVTGEKITRVAVDSGWVKEIDLKLAEHNKNNNKFMILSQQVVDLTENLRNTRKDMFKTDKDIKDTLNTLCKKMKLDPTVPWSYNLQLHVLELREPPDIKPVTTSQIAGSNG